MKSISILSSSVLFLACGAACGASFSSADLRNFSVELRDLDPHDNVAPTLAWQPSGGNGTSVSGYVSGLLNGGYSNTGSSPFAAVASGDGDDYIYAKSSVSGNVQDGLFLSAQGAADQQGAAGYTQYSAAVSVPIQSYDYYVFTLSAHSMVSFGGDLTLNAQTTVGFDPLTESNDGASAAFYLQVDGVGSSGGGTQKGSDNEILYATFNVVQVPEYDETGQLIGYKNEYTPENKTLNRRVGVSFVNNSDQALIGRVRLSLEASGSTFLNHASPAPEPECLLLAACGLGFVVFKSRKQRRGQRLAQQVSCQI